MVSPAEAAKKEEGEALQQPTDSRRKKLSFISVSSLSSYS